MRLSANKFILVTAFLVTFSFANKAFAIGLQGVYCVGPSAAYIPPSGVTYVNANTPYNKLGDAYSDLTLNGAAGQVIFELQNDYNSANEPNPLTCAYQGSINKQLTIRVRKDLTGVLVIEKPRSNADIFGVLNFDAASYITIDGSKQSGSCDTVGLIIRNNGFLGNTISCENDANHITVINAQVEIAQGGNAFFLETNTGIAGNDNITVKCSTIKPRTDQSLTGSSYSGFVTRAITTSTCQNDSITIRNCKFDNCHYSIYIQGTGDNGRWNILNNHFYKSSSIPPFGSFMNIAVNDTATIKIEGNYFGGSAPFCGGAQMQITNFSPINLSASASSQYNSSFSNNFIENIAASGSIYLLQVNGNAFNIDSNTIGNPAVADDIITTGGYSINCLTYSSNHNVNTVNITNNSFSNITVPTYNWGTEFIGINYSANGVHNKNIIGNTFKDITTANYRFYGIQLSSVGGSGYSTNVSYNVLEKINQTTYSAQASTVMRIGGDNLTFVGNRIGSLSQANSVNLENPVFGIVNLSSVNGFALIENNIVANVNLNSIANDACNVFMMSASNSGSNISRNSIKNISTRGTRSDNGVLTEMALSGFYLNGSSLSVTDNNISGLHAITTGASNPGVAGILITSAGNNLLERNVINQLTNTASNTAPLPFIVGIYQNAENSKYINNMIALSNGSNTNAVTIYGIKSSNSYHRKFYNNTIAISGVTSGNANSYAYFRIPNGQITDTVKNNIFYNSRLGGSGKHYSIANEAATANEWGVSDFNNYYTADANTLAQWGNSTDYDFAQWKTATSGDSNSKDSNVIFVDIDTNLRLVDTLNCALNNAGTPVGLISDIDGYARSLTNPDIGADEFSCITLSATITSAFSFCEGDTIKAHANVTGGTAPYKYSWTGPNNFTSPDSNLVVPIPTMINVGYYRLKVIDSQNQSYIDSVFIDVNPLPSDASGITGNNNIAACVNQSGNIYTATPIAFSEYYLWTVPNGATIVAGDSTSSITVNYSAYSQSGNVTVKGLNACGVGLADLLSINFTPIPVAEICRANVDSATQKTIIEWQKPNNSIVSGYVIYRENAASPGNYAPIDTVANTVFSSYLDTGSHPNLHTEKYKIAVLDSCGNIGDISAPFEHETIHLYGYTGFGGVAKLYWTPYIGITDTTRYYRVMRDTLGNGPFVPIDSTDKNTLYSKDVNSANYPLCRYVIEMAYDGNCTPSLRTLTSRSTTRSNIRNKSYFVDSVIFVNTNNIEKEIFNVHIYPNPAKDAVTIELDKIQKNLSIKINNVLGQTVLLKEFKTADEIKNKIQLPLNGLKPGIYFVAIENANYKRVLKLQIL